MAENKSDIRAAGERAVHQKTGDRACRIENELDYAGRNPGYQIYGATGFGRMDENDGLAAIQLVENRTECRVARPFVIVTRLQVGAVRSESFKSVFDLRKTAVHVRQRKRGKHPEAPRIILGKSRSKFIRDARELAGIFLAFVPGARHGQRQNG